jgi:hypothetical protein
VHLQSFGLFDRHRAFRVVCSVNFGEIGVIRCDKYRTYINPHVYWPPADRGARWRCNLCGAPNDVPQVYQMQCTYLHVW